MKYAPQILILGSNPAMDLRDKAKIAYEIIEKALFEFETYLFFIEDVVREIVSQTV
ncbi:MAG: hypothetical protein QW820_06975 [Sulfolobales archaeon]